MERENKNIDVDEKYKVIHVDNSDIGKKTSSYALEFDYSKSELTDMNINLEAIKIKILELPLL